MSNPSIFTVNGGKLTSLNNLSVSSGTLDIRNGGTVNAIGASLGYRPAGSPGNTPYFGYAVVSDPGSSWTANNLSLNFGTLTIQNQALLYVADTLTVNTETDFNNSRFATLSLSGGTLRFDEVVGAERVFFNSGTIQLAGNRILGNDAVISRFFGGSNTTIVANKGLTVEGTATINSVLTIAGGTFTTYGLNVPNPTLFDFDRGVFEVTGSGTIGGLTSLNLRTNAEFRARGFHLLSIAGAPGSTITATGDLEVGGIAVDGFATQGKLNVGPYYVNLRDNNDVVFDSLALVTIGSGATPGTLAALNGMTVDFGANVTGFGTINTQNIAAKPLINNGHIAGTSAAQKLTLSGYVKGVGTLDNVTVTGTLAPGFSPTRLAVGNLALAPTSTLAMELGGYTAGSEYDQLASSGALTLDGTLQVSLLNGFSPAAGQSFNLLDWSSVGGSFDAVSLPTLASGLSWNTSQLYTTGSLSVGFASDFNDNGNVNAADLSLWKTNFGKATGATHGQGDANADGKTDGGDLLSWQRQFGSAFSTTAVPEPTAGALAIFALTVGASASNRRR